MRKSGGGKLFWCKSVKLQKCRSWLGMTKRAILTALVLEQKEVDGLWV